MDSDLRHSAEEICRQVYDETRSFYAEWSPLLGEAACGFQILCGQPIIHAPTLFLGYQPGGSQPEKGDVDGWPDELEHVGKPWLLAKRVRQVWDVQTLRACTGLNTIFFRSPSMRTWSNVPAKLRREMECFSRKRAERIIRALAPQRLVIIGLATFDRLTIGEVKSRTERRVLVKSGHVWGAPAFGAVHLSGARVSRNEMDQLRKYFADLPVAAAVG